MRPVKPYTKMGSDCPPNRAQSNANSGFASHLIDSDVSPVQTYPSEIPLVKSKTGRYVAYPGINAGKYHLVLLDVETWKKKDIAVSTSSFRLVSFSNNDKYLSYENNLVIYVKDISSQELPGRVYDISHSEMDYYDALPGEDYFSVYWPESLSTQVVIATPMKVTVYDAKTFTSNLVYSRQGSYGNEDGVRTVFFPKGNFFVSVWKAFSNPYTPGAKEIIVNWLSPRLTITSNTYVGHGIGVRILPDLDSGSMYFYNYEGGFSHVVISANSIIENVRFNSVRDWVIKNQDQYSMNYIDPIVLDKTHLLVHLRKAVGVLDTKKDAFHVLTQSDYVDKVYLSPDRRKALVFSILGGRNKKMVSPYQNAAGPGLKVRADLLDFVAMTGEEYFPKTPITFDSQEWYRTYVPTGKVLWESDVPHIVYNPTQKYYFHRNHCSEPDKNAF